MAIIKFDHLMTKDLPDRIAVGGAKKSMSQTSMYKWDGAEYRNDLRPLRLNTSRL